MPLVGHPDDCECCVQIRFTPGARGTKRPRPVAEEHPFELPDAVPPPPPYDWEEEGGEEDGEEEEDEEEAEVAETEEGHALLNATLFKAFDAHVNRLDAARLKRIEALSFKSALEDDGEGGDVNEDASLDEIEGLGVWMPGDEFQGDVNYRTLQKLLTRVDQRGFERSAQQLEASVSEYGGRTRDLWVESPASSPLDQSGFLLCARAVPRRVHESGRQSHLPRLVGDRAAGHHEEVRLGEVEFGGSHIDTAPFREIVGPRTCAPGSTP